jgi:preprotein translocase subunit SecD
MIVVANSDIAQAKVVPRPERSDFMVSVTLTPAGARKMRAATERNIGKRMAILIDGVVVTAPVVNSVISEAAVVEGHLTKHEAERIVAGITLPAR